MNQDVAPSPAALLRRCALLWGEQKFQELLDLLRDYPDADAAPRLLRLKLMAALAVNDPAVLDSQTPLLAVSSNPPKAAFGLIREMDRRGFRDAAAEILLSQDALHDHPTFIRQIGRCISNRPDSPMLDRLQAALTKASKGGVDIVREASDFAAPVRGSDLSLGTVTMRGSTATAREHLKRLARDTASFKARLKKPRDATIEEYHNVFIDRLGQIWSEDGAIIVSRGLPIAPVTRQDVPNLPIGLNLVTKTRGIYHFLVDRIPLLAWMMDNDAARDVPVLLNGGAPGFERELMDLAGFGEDRVYAIKDVIFVERLVMVIGGFETLAGWHHIAPVMDGMVERARRIARQQGTSLPDQVYISRSMASRRPMTNEDAVHDAMTARGITVLHFETLPVWHQIAIASHARTIVAPHGAGLAHLVAAATGTQVIEIVPINARAYVLRWNYARLSLLKRLRYAAWIEEQHIPRSDKWTTSIDEFLPFLDAQLALTQSPDAVGA